MSQIAWKAGTFEDGSKAVKLEQVLQLAEEMFDSLADHLKKKISEKRSEK